jgi:DNA-binding NtrC family response regulator
VNQARAGANPALLLFDFVRKAAPINAPVLILGESGTGKEMLAKAIYRRSAQNGGPFVAIKPATRSSRTCWKASFSATKKVLRCSSVADGVKRRYRKVPV